MQVQEFFSRLFADYVGVTPQAARIHDVIAAKFGSVKNDHVALRTVANERWGLTQLEVPFLEWGYRRDRSYHFPHKHLRAYGYIPDDDSLPLLFLSELVLAEMPPFLRNWFHRASAQATTPLEPLPTLLLGVRPWALPTFAEYQELNRVSPYAAWLSVWGFRANHFTVAVHELPARPGLGALVETLMKEGVAMNTEGGLIQGTRADCLEQASTLAEPRLIQFKDGEHEIPSCYYEFAERHLDPDGHLYRGFVAQSANNIFESTTARTTTSDASPS
jgi:hypothetical protein